MELLGQRPGSTRTRHVVLTLASKCLFLLFLCDMASVLHVRERVARMRFFPQTGPTCTKTREEIDGPSLGRALARMNAWTFPSLALPQCVDSPTVWMPESSFFSFSLWPKVGKVGPKEKKKEEKETACCGPHTQTQPPHTHRERDKG